MTKRKPPKPRPKQKGEKDHVDYGRTVKSSVRAIIAEVVANEALTVRDAVMAGFKSGPKTSHHFLKLAAEQLDGKGVQPHSFDLDELAGAKAAVSARMASALAALNKDSK